MVLLLEWLPLIIYCFRLVLHLILRAVCPEGLELASWVGLGRAAVHRLESGLGPAIQAIRSGIISLHSDSRYRPGGDTCGCQHYDQVYIVVHPPGYQNMWGRHVGSDLADGWACEWISHGGGDVLKASSRSNNAGQANWACTPPGAFKMLQKPYKYQRRCDTVAGAGQGLPVIPKVRQSSGTTGGVRWQYWRSSGPDARGCRVGSAWWKWRRQW